MPIAGTVDEDGPYTALIYSNNWWWNSQNLTIKYWMAHQLSADDQRMVGDYFKNLAGYVDSVFVTRSFKVHVGACDAVNAFSERVSGNITYCSELLFRLRDSNGATDGVFFHELGHTSLGLWQMPGNTEENMADQFAVFMLLQLRGGIGAAEDMAKYFESSSNPWTDAWQIIQLQDTHAIGAQRAKFVRDILRDPDEFMERWNLAVYPRMQSANLRRIAMTPRPYESSALAQQELRRRGEMP